MKGHFVIVSVFAGLKEEEEGNDDHVHSGSDDVSSRSGLCHDGDATENLDWDRLDAQGCRIRGSFPCFDSSLKAEINDMS